MGVKLFIAKDWKEVLLTRPGFYDVVIVSRPNTMENINKVLLGANKSSKFAVVYNAEYLRCRRGALLQEMYRSKNKSNNSTHVDLLQLAGSTESLWMDDDQRQETLMMQMSDMVLTVSDKRKEILQKCHPMIQKFEL